MTARQRRHILAIDIGGAHVKMRVSNRRAVRQFDSSPAMTPREMLRESRKLVKDWTFNRVALGYPGIVVDGRIVSEPVNLGPGWVGFNFAKQIDRPVRVMNDAVMQALARNPDLARDAVRLPYRAGVRLNDPAQRSRDRVAINSLDVIPARMAAFRSGSSRPGLFLKD